MANTLIIVSFYNERCQGPLDNLLFQLNHIAAGAPFDTLVVVNKAADEDLAVVAKFPQAELIYRPNSGYNIGAWDYGWRTHQTYENYLLL